ncbi:MAG: hypothetical protein KDB82_12135 [Planctomycetes bacterium]|nr:hypothetical protein [Planctomycetota bacterium]
MSDEPRGHYDAIRMYHDHARETLRQFAHANGLRVDGWHYTLDRNAMRAGEMEFLAVSGTVIARANFMYFCLRFSLSLQPGRTAPLPVNFPTFKVRRIDAAKAAHLNFTPEQGRMEITPVC